MQELMEYRVKLLHRMKEATAEFVQACQKRGPFAKIEGSEWNTHQFAAHVRDVDKAVYGQRIRRTAQEDNPLFHNFDADEWQKTQYDANEPLEKILGELTASMEDLCAFLNNLPVETWSRESRHESYGSGFTLQQWAERGLAHIEEHRKSLI